MSEAPPELQETRTYWRSIDRLLDSPALSEPPTPEFFDGADLPPDEIDRRTMMTLMGASFALAGTAACRRPIEHIMPYVNAPESIIPGRPQHYATTMTVGTDAVGLLVESHEGRPTKIEGNALHPASGGAANAWMQAAILGLYDPDRAARHLVRGDSGEHEPVAWDDVVADLIARRAADAGGQGLAILVAPYASPSMAQTVQQLRENLPRARLVVHDPAGDSNTIIDGQRSLYHLDKARVIVDLDADLLGNASGNVRHTRGFAAGRRLEGDSMSRLYAVESTVTVTGASADHRLRVRRDQIPAVVAALAAELGAAELGVGGAPAGELAPGAAAKITLIARDLEAAGAAGLVAVGRAQAPAVHALVLAINRHLGAVGRTVTLSAPGDVAVGDVAVGDREAFAELLTAIGAGEVETLVVLGANPAYTVPGFAAALENVAHSICLSTHHDETASVCSRHIAEAGFLEAWGDAVAADGTVSPVQPLIAPLFAGKSVLEVLSLLATGEEKSGYDVVRETWQARAGGALDEKIWRRALHDGVLDSGSTGAAPTAAGSSSSAAADDPEAEPAAASAANADAGAIGAAPAAAPVSSTWPAASPGGIEATFELSRSVHDGRFANNSWLQELPDPITKIVWDNAALISPATATELELESGDVVRLTSGEQAIEIPVWVTPGQADGSIALELGYGRRNAGRVGDGVGVDVQPLRPNGEWTVPVTLEKTGRQYHLVQTQEHGSMEGRPLVREATLDEHRSGHHHFALEHEAPGPQPFDSHSYAEGYQWGMAIDLNACTGCNACVIACQSENNIPVVGRDQVDRGREMHWLRIDRYFTGSAEEPGVAVQPIPCMHCENAPCEQVCPVAATVHDDEGINGMIYNRCIGTRYCSNNCPYKVRRFNFFNYTKDTPELLKMANNPDVTVRSRGVMEKCSYCVQRISETKIHAKHENRKVRDGEITTACQQTCPADAIVFGDINDESSRVTAMKNDSRNYVLLGDLNNRPRTTFLGRIRNPNPAWGEA